MSNTAGSGRGRGFKSGDDENGGDGLVLGMAIVVFYKVILDRRTLTLEYANGNKRKNIFKRDSKLVYGYMLQINIPCVVVVFTKI